MKVQSTRKRGTPFRTSLLLAFVLIIVFSVQAYAANLPGLSVVSVDADGNTTPIAAYRWLVEENKTYHVQTLPSGAADRTTFDPNWDQLNDGIVGGETLSVGFHQSYMPIVAQGCLGCQEPQTDPEIPPVAVPDIPFSMAALDLAKHYYVSVLPNDAGTGEGHTIGGAQIPPGTTAGASSAAGTSPTRTEAARAAACTTQPWPP